MLLVKCLLFGMHLNEFTFWSFCLLRRRLADFATLVCAILALLSYCLLRIKAISALDFTIVAIVFHI